MSLPTFFSDITSLSIEERIELAQAIWDSIPPAESLCEITDEQKRELDRRMAAHAANPGEAIPWETVKAQALSRTKS